jgi:dipeptidyl aminopeptidase/acylaminoacyl peptidase
MWERYTAAEFSPDGSRIAVLHQAAPGDPQIPEQTLIDEIASGAQHPLALPLQPPRWSPDGRMIVGETSTRPRVVATCPADGGDCIRLGPGQKPVWSADGSSIYFLRDTADPAFKELWSTRPDGKDERKLFDQLGPFRQIDVTFDVARDGTVIWSQYIEGRPELWQAMLRR